MESASSGILAGINAVRRFKGEETLTLPVTSMMGALANHVAKSESKDFQPMGANFGVMPVVEPHIRDKRERYMAIATRAIADLEEKI